MYIFLDILNEKKIIYCFIIDLCFLNEFFIFNNLYIYF